MPERLKIITEFKFRSHCFITNVANRQAIDKVWQNKGTDWRRQAELWVKVHYHFGMSKPSSATGGRFSKGQGVFTAFHWITLWVNYRPACWRCRPVQNPYCDFSRNLYPGHKVRIASRSLFPGHHAAATWHLTPPSFADESPPFQRARSRKIPEPIPNRHGILNGLKPGSWGNM